MNKWDLRGFGVAVATTVVILVVLRDRLVPYSGLLAAGVALILVYVTAVYVRQVARQAQFAQDTVEEMKKQRETMYKPAVLIRRERSVEGNGFIRELGIVLDNQAGMSAINIELWAHHRFLDYGPKRYIAAIPPLGKSDGNGLGVEGELAPSPASNATTLTDTIVTVVAEYQGIDGSYWHSICEFVLDQEHGIGRRNIRVALPGKYIGPHPNE